MVDLSAEQVHHIEAAEETFYRQVHRIESALREETLGPDEARAHFREVRHTLAAALREVLTEHQLAQVQESRILDFDLNANGADEPAVTMSDDASNTAVPEQSWGQIKSEISSFNASP